MKRRFLSHTVGSMYGNLHLHEWLIFMIDVGKSSIHYMDPMGIGNHPFLDIFRGFCC